MIDESHFVTGSDNGNVALWSLAKKKPLTTKRLSHGLQPQFTPIQASSESNEELALQQILNHNLIGSLLFMVFLIVIFSLLDRLMVLLKYGN